MNRTRVVLVAKRSAYGRQILDEDDPRARELVARNDPSVKRWKAAHESHVRTLDEVQEQLSRLGARVLTVLTPNAAFDASDAELVITVGGDGTLLSASHHVAHVPVLGINSSPDDSVGFFCAADRSTIPEVLPRALDQKVRGLSLTRMEVRVNGRVRSRRVLNEALYCHASPAATSRYIMRFQGKSEDQRSSGLWIGPAAGSTAAQRSAGGRVLPLGSKKLQLVVREPYVPEGSSYDLMKVLIRPEEELEVRSKMQSGSLFLDGPHQRLRVRLGDRVVFRASEEPLRVLGLRARSSR